VNTIEIMNDELYKNKIRIPLKRLELLSYIAGAVIILGAIVFYPEVLAIVPWIVRVYIVVLGLYLVAQGVYLRKLRARCEKPKIPEG